MYYTAEYETDNKSFGLDTVIKNLLFKFIIRLEKSDNKIIQGLVRIEMGDVKIEMYLCNLETVAQDVVCPL